MKRFAITISIFLIFSASNLPQLNSAPNLRFVSLTPATTEILFALGLNEEIVGVTAFCDYPPEAKNIEKVGSFSEPSIEKILKLNPGYIFATGLEQEDVVHKLRQLNLKVYVSHPSCLSELFTTIEEIGSITHRKNEALFLIKKMQSKIGEVENKVRQIPAAEKPKVFVEIWHNPLFTAGKNSFVDELISLAGGVNIAYNTPRPYSYFSPELLIKYDPDCIILGHSLGQPEINQLKNQMGWQNVKAVKNNRIYADINPDLFLRPGPRLIEGLEEIYKAIHKR